MPFRAYGLSYLLATVIFFGLDCIWLGATANRLYRPLLGDLLADRFQVAPAAIFYLIYGIGIVAFAVAPALDSGRWSTACLSGALLGLIAYATYDLTNQATLRGWPVALTVADLVWGTFATAVAATLTTLAVRRLLPLG